MIEADKIKKTGYALDNEEFAKGIICIAVHVFDYTGNIVASIGISTLTLYDEINYLINDKFSLVRKVADEISLCLGAKKHKN